MKKILSSIAGKFLLVGAGGILFWLLATLYMIDRINKIQYFFTIQSLIDENLTRSAIIRGNSEILSTGLIRENFNSGSTSNDSEQLRMEMNTSLSVLSKDLVFRENLGFQRRINTIIESCAELERIENEFISLLINKGNPESGLIQKTLFILNRPPQNPIYLELFSNIKLKFTEYLIHSDPAILDDILSMPEFGLEAKTRGMLSIDESNFQNPEDILAMVHRNVSDLLRIDQKLGIYSESGLTNDQKLFNQQISNQLTNLKNEFTSYSFREVKTSLSRFYLFVALSGLFIVFWIIYLSYNIVKSLDKIQEPLSNLARGLHPKHQLKFLNSEFSVIADSVHSIAGQLKEKSEYAGIIAEGGEPRNDIRFSSGDELGNALYNLQQKIKLEQKEHEKRMEEEQKRNWHNEGIALFGIMLRTEKESVEELSFIIIRELTNYLKASHCSIFILNEEKSDRLQYDLISSFAFDRRKYLKKTIRHGEGLAGSCAREKATIYLTDLPDDYIEIKSGLGESPPRSLLIVPLKLKNDVYGILELASFNHFQSHEIAFVEQLAESIASALKGLKVQVNTAHLLDQFQKQAAEMHLQEEKMRQNLIELEKIQMESRKKEVEISGILNAVNSSSLVAEYSLNGRISSINENFASLLEIPPDQLIGKHHSELAETDKYNDAYKKFWQDIREGEIKTRNEKFRLMNGKELRLHQTFAPITDNEGNTIRILNIAVDISQTHIQQESLEKQALEIAAKNQEMKILSQAVDESMIKCEMNTYGVIENANSNYLLATGLTSREILGKNLRLFLRENEKEQFDNIMNQVMKGQSYSGVVKRTKPTGEEVWLMSGFTPVQDENGIVRKIYYLAQDITEKKLKYHLLEEANKEIERLKEKLSPKNL